MNKRFHGLRERAKHWNYPVILSHVILFLAVITVLTIGYRPSGSGVAPSSSLNSITSSESQVPTVDEVASASVAATVATSAEYLVANNVTERANTIEVKNALAQSSDADYLSKPQFVDPGQRQGVGRYTVQEGDNVQIVADSFGLTTQTVQWANGLTENDLEPGTELFIPAVDGVVYTVKDGDTPESIAERYQAEAGQILALNDVDTSGLQPGQIIVVPGGTLPEEERPGAGQSTTPTGGTTGGTSVIGGGSVSSGFAFGSGPVFGGNGYANGYCTWHAANRRAAIGRPIPNNWGNATTWDEGARAMGMRVDSTPEVGAVMQVDGGWGGYGHVAFVEQVNPDGSWVISEMNYAGWNVVSSRTFSAAEAANYDFIH